MNVINNYKINSYVSSIIDQLSRQSADLCANKWLDPENFSIEPCFDCEVGRKGCIAFAPRQQAQKIFIDTYLIESLK